MPRYPQVQVKLVGEDGNAFAILGRCEKAAKTAGLTSDQIQDFMTVAKSGDYHRLLLTCIEYFDCDPVEDWDDDEEEYEEGGYSYL